MPRGGPQPGSGRPKGKLSPATIERERTLAEIRAQIARKASVIVQAQLALAIGLSILYKIEVDEEGNRGKPEVVTSEEEITHYFEECHGEPGEVDGAYYYITTLKPDNAAIEGLLNRTFGRAKETVEVTGANGGPIEHTIKLVRATGETVEV